MSSFGLRLHNNNIMFQSHIAGDWNDNVWNEENYNQVKFSSYSDNNSYFIFQIFVNKKIRNSLIKSMVKNFIGCSIHYATPLPYFDYYKKKLGAKRYINAEYYAKSNISLPIHSSLNIKQIKYITDFIVNNTK